MVLDVDPVKRRISLGLKQCLDNPWDAASSTSIPVGTELEGEVKNITEFGLFVGLPGEIDGMVHLSDLDWDKPGEEAVKDFKKGDSVKVKVLDVDVEKERISPRHQAARRRTRSPRPPTTLKKGTVVTCTVTARRPMAASRSRSTTASPASSARRTCRATAASSAPTVSPSARRSMPRSPRSTAQTRKLTLSIKAKEVEEDKQAMAEFGSSDSGASLGDILGAALNKAKKGKKDDEEA